jgi:mRNA-degrading endonuclease toxin of MazEF toxin-antitoxin module
MKTILRGEIGQVRFNPNEGSEIGKTRTALVLQKDIGNRYVGTYLHTPAKEVKRSCSLPDRWNGLLPIPLDSFRLPNLRIEVK